MHRPTSDVIVAAPELDGARRELASRIVAWVPGMGRHAAPIHGLHLIRIDHPGERLPTVYEPSLCVVVQGRKRAFVGNDELYYDPLNFLVVSLMLPIVCEVIEASPDQPYLCLQIMLEAKEVAAVALQMDDGALPVAPREPCTPDECPAYLARTSPALLDTLLRLVRLLDTPGEAAMLAPLVMRELYFRLLSGEQGRRLRVVTEVDSHTQRIARSIELIKRRFDRTLRVEELAAAAHMSPSSLHHHFKQLTHMTPLQYQKHLRLHEARRLMLIEGLDAGGAAHRVGYESPSQFSREYRRLFGAPPRREVASLRARA